MFCDMPLLLEASANMTSSYIDVKLRYECSKKGLRGAAYNDRL